MQDNENKRVLYDGLKKNEGRCKGHFIIYVLPDVLTLLSTTQYQKKMTEISLTVLKQIIFELLKGECTAGGT